MPPFAIPGSSLRRAIAVSVALHVVAAIIAGRLVVPARDTGSQVVDIEIAPPVPLPEALPPELPRPAQREAEHADRVEPAPEPESTAPGQPGESAIDAGVDAAPDAAPDAVIDARPDARPDASIDAAPDAPIDAGVPDAALVASGDLDAGDADATAVASDLDAGVADATAVASSDLDAGRGDAGAVAGNDLDAGRGDASAIASSEHRADRGDGGADSVSAASTVASPAAGSGSAARPAGASGLPGAAFAAGSNAGSDAGSAIDTTALAEALAQTMPGAPGTAPEPAVEGAPTTAGTAANLLAYFPAGHLVTALIRFDRLRGTEWAAQTEALLQPMPDYQLLFGAHDADVLGKLETLVISTPQPRDAAATTLVGRTQLSRAALRDALGAGSAVTWSVARGGLLGRRTSKRFPSDQRVFLSPFAGWFLLAQPGDLGNLTAAARGKLDTAVAAPPLPPWLAGLRAIEAESGDKRGPALVATVAVGGQRIELPGYGLALGVRSIPLPERASLAAELVPQGWLVRGNLRFASDADASEFVVSVQRLQLLAGPAVQALVGKRVARVVRALAFARNGARVSYATSVSIADARAILTAAARQMEQYFRRVP